MEIAPVPRPRPLVGRGWLLVAVAILAPLIVFVAVPGMLGLHRYVVSSDELSGSIGRGSLVFSTSTAVGDLEVGDVVTFRPPSPYDEGHPLVTRRVIAVGPLGIHTAVSRGITDPWVLPTSGLHVDRMVVHVAYLGYPFLGSVDRTMWLMLASLPLAAVALALAGDVERSRQLQTRRAVVRLPELASK